ncbi:unnamed protein product, partial [Hapterophycus canaliculatus]
LPPLVPAPPAPVPSTQTLRMLFSILKHNPTEAVQEVGVLLMLHASSIEVAKATAAAVNPSDSGGDDGGGGNGKRGRISTPRVKEREEIAKLKRRTHEAEELLAIAALASEEKDYPGAGQKEEPGGDSTGSVLPAAGAAKTTRKKTGLGNKTRFQHQLRQPVKVEDRLRAWAATRGREVAGLRELLGLSVARKGKGSTAVVQPSPAAARLVRDRIALISAESVKKALPEARLALGFISYAVGARVRMAVTVRESIAADTTVEPEMR